MATGSGLCSQVGYAAETVVGTAVTTTRFLEHNSFKPTHTKITKTSQGLRACTRGIKAKNRVVVGKSVSLDVEHDVFSKGFGLLLKHMLGSAGTATQIAATAAYRQTHLPGDTTGLALTVQAGFPESYTGTVRPYTYNGCKVTDWELSCKVDEILSAKLSLDGWNWTTATALATAAYVSSDPFNWATTSATVGGTASTTGGRTTVATGVAIKGLRGISVKGKNPIATDRRFAGGGGIKAEQLPNGRLDQYTVELDTEFADRTQLADIFDTDATTPLFLSWSFGDAGGGNPFSLTVTVPQFKLDSGSPEIGGPDIVDGKVQGTAYEDDAGLNPLLQVELVSSDTAI
jgi:hypothetical protein